MKKTTKILLVLAAVVAMTIGAVSTVMAADFPEVAEWSYNSSTKKYSAKDADGETIVRGWATDEGRWYFFDSSVMLANTFITYKEDIYYLDNYGCMAIGWIEFAKDAEVAVVDKYDDAYKYENVTKIEGFGDVFEIDREDALGGELFKGLFDKGVNKTVWCYFDEHGVMANDEWVQPESGLWYYMYGPYCVMGDYHVAINNVTKDGKWFNDGTDGVYGFDNNGAMLVGWNLLDRGADDGDKYDADTPYEDIKGVKDADRYYTYYLPNGRQVNTEVKEPAENQLTYDGFTFEGWEKIGGKWYYFIDDADLGLLCLQDTVLFDVDTEAPGLLGPDGQKGTFYLDKDGAMVTGTQSFKKDTEYFAWNEDTTSYGIFEVVTGHDGVFYFNDTIGKMEDGVIGKYYYKNFTNNTDVVYLVEKADITTNGFITIDETNNLDELNGQRLEGKNFFLEMVDANDIDGDKDEDEVVILYFESGRWQKNQGITFGETTIAINDKGIVCDGAADAEITIDGFKYKFVADDVATFTIGSTVINGVVRK